MPLKHLSSCFGPSGPSSAPSRALDWPLVVFFTLLGAWLRLSHLGVPSLWWDEFITLGNALQNIPWMWESIGRYAMNDVGGEYFPPLLHTLLHMLPGLKGNDLLARLPQVVFGVLSIPAVYVLGRRLFGSGAGLAAAFLLSTSGYHIHYSREVRPYALFLLLNILAMIWLYAGLSGGRIRAWLAYALTVAAMLYTSYLASTALAAHGLFVLACVGPQAAKPGFEGRQARKTLAWAALSWGLALGAYAYWLPNQLRLMDVLRDPSHASRLTWAFLHSALKEFAGYTFRGDASSLLAITTGLGVLFCLRERKCRELLLLSLLAGLPLLGVVLAQTQMDLSSRYIINAYLCCLLLSAMALDGLAKMLAERLALPDQAATMLRPCVILVLASFLAYPSLAFLPNYYKREPSFYKDNMAWLLENKNNVDWLLFPVNRNLKVITDWYLGKTYRNLADFDPEGYKRAYLLSTKDAQEASGAPLVAHLQDMDVHAVGLANASPVLLMPDAQGQASYNEDFSSFRLYRDCLSAKNLAPDLMSGSLSHYDYSRPAEAVYRFTVPSGSTVEDAGLDMDWRGAFLPQYASVAETVLWLSLDGVTYNPLDRLTPEDFRPKGGVLPDRAVRISRHYALGPLLRGQSDAFLKISYGPITTHATIEAAGLRLNATLTGPAQTPESLAGLALANALKHNTLARWRPNVFLVDSLALYAFAHPGALAVQGVGGPQDLDAFTRVNPGLPPVLVVPFPDGSPAYSLFDPALSQPFVAVSPDRPVELISGHGPDTAFTALKLRGRLDGLHLTLGKTALEIPVSVSLPAELTVNAGSQARLTVSPVFTADQTPMGAPIGENLHQLQGEGCLSCIEDRACSMTITLRSGWPIKGFRLVAFPRVFADPGRKNSLLTSYQADGRKFVLLDDYRSNASGLWEGWKIRRIHGVQLAVPARTLAVRFELSGQGAQLWSTLDSRMRLEVDLDAHGWVPLRFEAATARLEASLPVEALFLPEPAKFPDSLRTDY